MEGENLVMCWILMTFHGRGFELVVGVAHGVWLDCVSMRGRSQPLIQKPCT